MRPFQFHLKEHWRYPQSLETLLPWSDTISAHLEWWQNPVNVMKGSDLHPKDNSIQLFTDALNKGSVVRQATHKYSKVEGCFTGPSKVQEPVPKPDSVATDNNGSLHKQTGRNPLGGDVHSAVEDHDLVLSLSDNPKSQTHSRVP